MNWAGTLSSRRAIKALAITLSCGFLLGGSLGFVQAQGESTAPPAEFSLPRPAVGDEAIYTMELAGDWKYDGEPFPDGTEYMRFNWGPVHPVVDSDGRLQPASTVVIRDRSYNPLAGNAELGFSEQYWGIGDYVQDVHAGTFDTISFGVHAIESFNANSAVVGVPVLAADVDVAFHGRFYNGAMASAFFQSSCILASPFHGVTVDFSDDIEFGCSLPGLVMSAATADVKAIGWKVTQTGHRALQVQVSDADSTINLYYAPGIAYPVELHAIERGGHDVHQGSVGDREVRLVQSNYAAGTTPVVDDGRIRAPPLAPPAMVPVGDRGILDDSGVNHPFPASFAWQQALNHPTEPLLRDFLNAHPEAYVFSQTYTRERTDDRLERIWDFELKANNGLLAIESVQVTRAPAAQEALPADPLVQHELREPQFSSVEAWAKYAPPPGEQPTTAARAADLLTWHEAFSLFDAPARSDPAYGFRLMCMSECENQSAEHHAGWTVGFESNAVRPSSGTTELPQVSSLAVEQSTLTFNAAPQMLMIIEYALGVAHGPPSLDGDALPPNEGTAPQDEQPTWAPLPAPVTAGVAGFALLVGAAYYFAPLLKGVPMFGLFSRLQRSELLNHPRRAEIMNAIETNAGIHFKQLQRTTGIANGTLHHHLRIMTNGGLIQARRGSGYTCYYAGDRLPAAVVASAPILKSKGARAVLNAVAQNPGLSGNDVGKYANLSSGTVGYHLRKLRAAGLIEGTRDERRVRLALTNEGRRLAKAA